MKVKELIKYLQKFNQEGKVFIETDDDLLNIYEVTNGKSLGTNNQINDFVVLIPDREV